MLAVLMVEMRIHEVISMVSVGNGLMATGGAVPMLRAVTLAIVRSGARRGVLSGDGKGMLVYVIAVHSMEVTFVHVVVVIVVAHPSVSAAIAVAVIVVAMCLVFHATSKPHKGRAVNVSSQRTRLDVVWRVRRLRALVKTAPISGKGSSGRSKSVWC